MKTRSQRNREMVKERDGHYVYAYLREDGSPYYIGQGQVYRITANPLAPPEKERRIFLKKNLSQEDAWRYEEYYISLYGRERDGGILINRSLGGKRSGLEKHSPESIEKKRLSMLGKNRRKHSEKEKREQSIRQKKLYAEGILSMPSQEKPFAFISPSGIINRGTNIRQFADENGLSVDALYDVRRGKQKQHKGWRKA